MEVNIQPGIFVGMKDVDNSARRLGTYWDCARQIQMCGHPTRGSQRTV